MSSREQCIRNVTKCIQLSIKLNDLTNQFKHENHALENIKKWCDDASVILEKVRKPLRVMIKTTIALCKCPNKGKECHCEVRSVYDGESFRLFKECVAQHWIFACLEMDAYRDMYTDVYSSLKKEVDSIRMLSKEEQAIRTMRLTNDHKHHSLLTMVQFEHSESTKFHPINVKICKEIEELEIKVQNISMIVSRQRNMRLKIIETDWLNISKAFEHIWWILRQTNDSITLSKTDLEMIGI